MRIGKRDPMPDAIAALGFSEVNETKILGMNIDYNLDCLHKCHDSTVKKIENIGNFWRRFNLSLPGRINVAKTLMLSQISYLGCFIYPKEQQLSRMTDCVEKYIKKNLNISKTKTL
jgi:hypothetical protein